MTSAPDQEPAKVLQQRTIRLHLNRLDPDPARSWVIQPVCEVVRQCQEALKSGGRTRMAIILSVPTTNPADQCIADAAVAAIRGLVHALTTEVGDRVALNLIVVSAGLEERAREALSFLEGEAGDLTQGATIDLMGEQ